MGKKQSELLSEEMELLRAEIKVIEEKEDATEDELSRAEALLDEWDQKKTVYDKAVEREAKVAEVMRSHLNPVNRENSDRRGPEIMRRVEPYEDHSFKELARSAQTGGTYDEKDAISRAHAAVEHAPRVVSDASKERMTELLEMDNKHAPLIARHMLMTGSAEYTRQFHEYVKTRGYVAGDLLRTAMSLTDANGGYLVPHFLDPTIVLTNSGIAGPIRSISTVKTIATKTYEGVTSAGVNAQFIGEATAATDASPTFGQISITPKHAAAWLFGSYEILQDSGFSTDLGRLLADAKVRLEETHFATGNTGATFPRGVIAAVQAVTASIVTSATTNALVVGDVYNVSDAVNPRQASQASWIANKKIFSKIRQFDTSGGGSFWANLGMGTPNQLLGQPVYECSPMTGVVSTGANVLLVGDFSEFYIVDRVGMSVLYEPMIKTTASGAAPTGQAGWYAFWRVGSDVANVDAFRLLQLNQVAAATALG